MTRPSNVTMRPDVHARARAIIARVLSAPLEYELDDFGRPQVKVPSKVWNKATNFRARQRAFRTYARQDVARQTQQRPGK